MMMLSQTINTWSKRKKENALQLLQQFGNVDEIIAHIDKMTYEYREGKHITKLDDKYYIEYNDQRLSILPTNGIMYCFQSNGKIGLILKNKVYWVNTTVKNVLTAYVNNDKYNFLCKILPCLEKQPYSPHSFHVKGAYGIGITVADGKFISYKESKLSFSKQTKQKILYETDILNVVWCYQVSTYNAETYEDEFYVNIFFRDGHRIILRLCDFKSPKGDISSFNFLMNLKKNVPHLLYGKNKEYNKIFQKNPEELFALAIQKCDK